MCFEAYSNDCSLFSLMFCLMKRLFVENRMEQELSQSNINEDKSVMVDDSVGSVQDQMKNIDLRNPDNETQPEEVPKDNNDPPIINAKSSSHETLKGDILDINTKIESGSDVYEDDMGRKENVSKTVGIGDAEEGELDYEEEVPEDDHRIHNDEQRVDHEETELADEKDVDGDKDAEGSEEGEIVTDDDEDADKTQKVFIYHQPKSM